MKKTLDWKQYEQKARQAIAEGCVLLKNDNQTLPLKKDCTVSIFGRIQSSYYKSGTGSGGMVNVSKVYNLVEGLEESGWVKINKDLQKIYAEWEEKNPDKKMPLASLSKMMTFLIAIEFIKEGKVRENDIVEIIIKTIEEELKNSSDTKYVCEDDSIISTDVRQVNRWFHEYKHVLREKFFQ